MSVPPPFSVPPRRVLAPAFAASDLAERAGTVEDWSAAVTAWADALEELDPFADRDLILVALTMLGHALISRLDAGGEDRDLNDALYCYADALTMPASAPIREWLIRAFVEAISRALGLRWRLESPNDLPSKLDEVIRRLRTLAQLQSPDPADSVTFLLSVSLLVRLDSVGDAEGRDEAIRLLRTAARDVGPVWMSRLGNALLTQFEVHDLNRRQDLLEAVAIQRDALQYLRPGTWAWTAAQVSLGRALGSLGQYFGDHAALEEGVAAFQRVITATPSHSGVRLVAGSGLVQLLMMREQLGDEESNLATAVDLAQELVETAEPGNPHRARVLTLAGQTLLARYGHTANVTDISAALTHLREAASIAEPGLPRAQTLRVLGQALSTLYRATGNVADRDAAFAILQDALAAERMAGHPLPPDLGLLSEPGASYLVPPIGWTGAGPPPPPEARAETTEPFGVARYVNIFTTACGGEEPVTALAPAAHYELLVNIGQRFGASLLPAAQALWPDELLPDGGVWLRAALLLDGVHGSSTVPFFLPQNGESFHCDCAPDAPHRRSCSPQRWVRFTVNTPVHPAVLQGELVIYFEAAAVVAVRLRLPVGLPDTAQVASLIGRLTSTFNDLGKLAGRTTSIVASSSSRVVVNGAGFLDTPFAIGASAADTSALNARTALFASHFEQSDSKLYSCYDSAFGKSQQAYEQDLRRLAREGAELYAKLFSLPGSDTMAAFTLPALLRHEARSRARPPVLQVIDDRFDEHAMLWSMIYDLPVGGDSSRYRPCPAVRQFGPGGDSAASIPAVCPYENSHHAHGDVLCPFGFWGLSCVIEQPPTVGRDLETVVFSDTGGAAILAAIGGSLDKQLTDQHIGRLRTHLSGCQVNHPAMGSGAELAAALGPEAMDVVYFYCHCGYDRRTPKAAADRYLDLGNYTVQPLDINMWARTVWAQPHWHHRRPLVVLNGCHTAESTSGTLNSFVPAFTHWAGASGVLGTEVTVEQGLASWAIEELLARITAGQPVGTALHSMRWAMLRRGNIMGLAYTAYCLANLTLRPTTAGQE